MLTMALLSATVAETETTQLTKLKTWRTLHRDTTGISTGWRVPFLRDSGLKPFSGVSADLSFFQAGGLV